MGEDEKKKRFHHFLPLKSYRASEGISRRIDGISARRILVDIKCEGGRQRKPAEICKVLYN